MTKFFSSILGGSTSSRRGYHPISGTPDSANTHGVRTDSANTRGVRTEPFRLRALTEGHSDYSSLLKGNEEPDLSSPGEHAPFSRGGATKRLRGNTHYLASRAAQQWTLTEGRPDPYTTDEAESIILSGITCPNAPPSTCATENDQKTEREALTVLLQAMADNDRDTALDCATKLHEMDSKPYAHMVECSHVKNPTCTGGMMSKHLSSLLLQDNPDTQWGCINTNHDTPGHEDWGKAFCNDPMHRPSQLMSYLEYHRRAASEADDPSKHVAAMDQISTSTNISLPTTNGCETTPVVLGRPGCREGFHKM
ncbi:hypothetical protein IAT40_001293 [Kwoniella sp. CBS 6097]